MKASRRLGPWLIATAISGALVLGGLGILHSIGELTDSAPNPVLGECKTLHCGPLRLVDCGHATDGSLLVFSRFPNRLLADCGFWTMGSNELLCRSVYHALPLCTPAPPKAGEVCGGSDEGHYLDGLAFHLARAGVPYRRAGGLGLCVDERFSAALKAAQRELDRHFPQVAHKPADQCEERALLAWAERERLRYDLRAAFDGAGRPSGNLFLLRSFTADEVASNRDKLEKSAPKGVRCK